MAENSKIEWCDHTFNPWAGCQPVSPACDHCYAEADTKRYGYVQWGPKADRRRTGAGTWEKPLKWNREAEEKGIRYRVFCASWADVFDNHKSIKPEWRDDIWNLIKSAPNLDWLLLTKRPQNIKKYLPSDWGNGYPNVWLGTTVESQEEANRRILHLLETPAKVRFLSCEPLLEKIQLWLLHYRKSQFPSLRVVDDTFDALKGELVIGTSKGYEWKSFPKIDWVIAGGESGHHARPSHPDWFRSLRDQCKEAGVPFLFKQWGEWLPWEPDQMPYWKSQDGQLEDRHGLFPADMDNDPKWDDGLWASLEDSHVVFQNVGKAKSGRELDGVIHDGYPRSE